MKQMNSMIQFLIGQVMWDLGKILGAKILPGYKQIPVVTNEVHYNGAVVYFCLGFKTFYSYVTKAVKFCY